MEPVTIINAQTIKKWYWKKLICGFGVPTIIVTNNGTQLASQLVGDFCITWKIYQAFTLLEHRQTNGQVEVGNKVILNIMKKQLDEAKGNWV